jgi:cytochrome c-type biogenesis protein CcmE
MTHRYIKLGLTVGVLILAFGGLLWSTLREGSDYFKNVDEVIADQQAWQGKSLQLHGYVIPGSIKRSRVDSLQWQFQIQNNPIRQEKPGGVMNIAYTGLVPDTFKGEAEVVLRGKLSPGGFEVVPNGVMAKCPSKYEAQSGAAPAGS